MLAYVPLRGLAALKYVFLCSHDDYAALLMIGCITSLVVFVFKYYIEVVLGMEIGGKVGEQEEGMGS